MAIRGPERIGEVLINYVDKLNCFGILSGLAEE